jgi:hypothetical protein
MKSTIVAMCSSMLLLSSGPGLSQEGDITKPDGSAHMKDSRMASDSMASGAMGVKQHPRKPTKTLDKNTHPAASESTSR